MKKVLFTINYYTNGGPSNVIKNIMNTLNKKKYNVTLMTFTTGNNAEYINELKKNGINVIECNIKRHYLKAFLAIKKAKKIIKNINPDIIHANGLYNGLIVANTKVSSKKIYTVHSNLFEDLKNTYGSIKGKIMLYIQLCFFKKYDYIVACSNSVYESLKDRCNNLVYVNNGIKPAFPKNIDNRSRIRKSLGIPDSAIVYIFCGHLNVHKRIVELTEMMNKSLKKDEYFIILGDGIFYDKLREIDNEHIKVLGFKNNAIDYFNASDIYVSNSDSEGFSISIIEALSQGLCLLLYDIPSHASVFKIDNNVYLGEIYKDNFNEKKELIYKKIHDIDINSIKSFQKKYLSNVSMTNGYEKYYLQKAKRE